MLQGLGDFRCRGCGIIVGRPFFIVVYPVGDSLHGHLCLYLSPVKVTVPLKQGDGPDVFMEVLERQVFRHDAAPVAVEE